MSQTLWQHQQRALAAAHQAINSGRARGLWVMPTGSGKTAAFMTLAAQLGEPTLVVVHRGELARQAADEASRRWPGAAVGLLPGKGWESAQVVVATVQSLSRRLAKFPVGRFGLLVMDEAHHAPADSWRAVLDHFQPRFALGCTATPDRADRQDVEGQFGGVIYQYALGDAMADKVV